MPGELAGLDAAVEELTRLVEQDGGADMAALEARSQALAGQREQTAAAQRAVHARLSANESALENLTAKGAQAARLEQQYTWMGALSATVNGNLPGREKVALETYVQMTFFDRILRRANVRLMVMSGGQYELARRTQAENNRSQSGLELDVVDHYNGSRRSVRTLSGGESFLASLSLALGLSDEIQSAAGGIRLDTMFVDEGFGSLDEDTLDRPSAPSPPSPRAGAWWASSPRGRAAPAHRQADRGEKGPRAGAAGWSWSSRPLAPRDEKRALFSELCLKRGPPFAGKALRGWCPRPLCRPQAGYSSSSSPSSSSYWDRSPVRITASMFSQSLSGRQTRRELA